MLVVQDKTMTKLDGWKRRLRERERESEYIDVPSLTSLKLDMSGVRAGLLL